MEYPQKKRSDSTNASTNPRKIPRVTYLERLDFHRDLILNAIKQIRVVKASKKDEIKAYLLSYHKIPLSDTDICIRKLHDRGDIVAYINRNCVSYLEPNEVKKQGVILNRPLISEKLENSIRVLISKAKGNTNSGFTEEEIKEVLYELENEATIPPELTGFKLRRALAVESKYGGLVELPNGCYTLKDGGGQNSLPSNSTTKIGERREPCPARSKDSSSPIKKRKLSPIAMKLPEAPPNTLTLTRIMSDLEMEESEFCATDLNAHSKLSDMNTHENSHFSESSTSEEFETQPSLITNSEELIEYLMTSLTEEEIMSGIPQWEKDPD
ncbi:unnamed protein product [Rodentolepis nana]|uniref:H15 domain-containing protein n=1 Tax=Rodentolepis nana TaxID=102285 RepID=A0A0R3TZJ0_RODNA|nr:unnamed protein product [Rodentolepis nana]